MTPGQIFARLFLGGLGLMLALMFISEGFREFFLNLTTGLLGFRQVRSDFTWFIAIVLLFAAIAMAIFRKK